MGSVSVSIAARSGAHWLGAANGSLECLFAALADASSLCIFPFLELPLLQKRLRGTCRTIIHAILHNRF